MPNIAPYLHIFFAICVYFSFAVLASLVARKAGINLKEMAARTTPMLLWIRAAANLAALLATLLLISVLDHRPVSAIGVSITLKDILFSLLAVTGTFVLASFYVSWLMRSRKFQVTAHDPVQGKDGLLNLIVGLLVVFVIATQEEVLYRGYIFLNLNQFGSIVFLVVSTLIFVLIHFLTNRVNLHQILSWLLSGLVLAVAYLISGSIWVPIFIHFAIDATNVLVFNITGKYGFFNILPPLTERDRTLYRLVYGITMLAAILLIYGLPASLV
jgi:membrane protease YdiL (CAAX protease family)